MYLRRLLIFIGLKLAEIGKFLGIVIICLVAMFTILGSGILMAYYVVGIKDPAVAFLVGSVLGMGVLAVIISYKQTKKWLKSNWDRAGELEKKWSKK
jgi:hypothetical protein